MKNKKIRGSGRMRVAWQAEGILLECGGSTPLSNVGSTPGYRRTVTFLLPFTIPPTGPASSITSMLKIP